MTESAPSDIYTINRQAMDWLKSGNALKSERYLLRAQNLLKAQEKSPKESRLWAITCNNLACVYKTSGDFEKAMKNLFLALETEEKYIKNPTNIAGIHLNISSIYSQMKLHKHSLQHSQEANRILIESSGDSEVYWLSLITSYFDIGTEYEFLMQNEQAIRYFTKGYELAQNKLGKFNNLTIKLKKSLEKCLNVKKTASIFTSRSITPTRVQNPSPKRNSEEEKSFPSIRHPKNRVRKSALSVKKHRLTELYQYPEQIYQKYPTYLKIHDKINDKTKVDSELIKKTEKNLVLEDDEESISLKSVSEDIETKKMSESVEPNENLNKPKIIDKIETFDKGVSCNFVQIKSVKDENIQTGVKLKAKECQVNFGSPKFKRIAAILIQKQWKIYQTQLSQKKVKEFKNNDEPFKTESKKEENSPVPKRKKTFL